MTTLKISKIEIQGFRAFGKVSQTLDFGSLIACIWGPNSQGKTSLAEAFEFLLTGQIVRRELMASAQDEFADALRNVHMPKELPTFVRATLTNSGKSYVVTRILSADYGKRQDCQTALDIDGKAATEADLAILGLILSQPPLRAPVLAQHTLGYLFSAKPQDRASYFKALLEVTDLESLRTSVANLDTRLEAPSHPLSASLVAASAIPAAGPALRPLSAKAPAPTTVAAAINAALDATIDAEGQRPPSTLSERIAAAEELLADKRSLTFPIRGFDKQLHIASRPALAEPIAMLAAYLVERGKVDEETRRLAALFVEALNLPAVAAASNPVDCPLCNAQDTLTPARVAFIRERVKDTEAFRAAEKAATGAVAQLHGLMQSLLKQMADSMPRFIVYSSKARRDRRFRIDRMRVLLGDDVTGTIAVWLRALNVLTRAWSRASRLARALEAEFQILQEEDLKTLSDTIALQRSCDELAGFMIQYDTAHAAYLSAEKPLLEALQNVVDVQSQTAGWSDLIEIAKDPVGLRTALIAVEAFQRLKKEIALALRQIDTGNGKVLQKKFEDLSIDISTWWDLLRPDELSFFSAVLPRPNARRTIDFKAGLSINDDRSNPALRDVIAVFSQSQLHCLGIALFIARSVHEKTGFIILDDPILSSDEDYRAHFNSAVLDKLMSLDVQIILLTQDQKTCKDLTERYLHRKIDTFQMNLGNHAEGTTVVNKADDLAAMLNRVEVLIRGGHPDLHRQGGEVLRNAAERFCKEMLVKDLRTQGDGTAAISDYDGKNLGELGPKTEPCLAIDASHPGKLRAIGSNLNPANHDDSIPAPGILKVALGDLRSLRKAYL